MLGVTVAAAAATVARWGSAAGWAARWEREAARVEGCWVEGRVWMEVAVEVRGVVAVVVGVQVLEVTPAVGWAVSKGGATAAAAAAARVLGATRAAAAAATARARAVAAAATVAAARWRAAATVGVAAKEGTRVGPEVEVWVTAAAAAATVCWAPRAPATHPGCVGRQKTTIALRRPTRADVRTVRKGR